MNGDSTIDKLAPVRVRFVVRCHEQAVRMTALREQLMAKSITDPDFEELARLCHSLYGTGGTLGYKALSALAYEAESACKPVLAAYKAGAFDPPAALDDLLKKLIAALEAL